MRTLVAFLKSCILNDLIYKQLHLSSKANYAGWFSSSILYADYPLPAIAQRTQK